MSPGLLPGLVTRNWRLKLAAFGLALFLWAAVRAEPERGATRTVTGVPVLVEVADMDWTVVGDPQPRTVDVQVTGSFGVFGGVADDLVLQIPVDRVSGTDTVVELRRDWVASAGGSEIQVGDISPPRVRIAFEETAETAVPVALRTTGRLPEELALAQPLSVYPSVVRVRGRASRVASVESLATEPLDLGTVSSSGSYPVALDTAGFGELTFRTAEATVEVRVEEAVERVVPGVPVVLDTVPEGADSTEVVMRPSAIRVTLRGGRTRVAQVDPLGLVAAVPARVVRALLPGEQRSVPVRIEGAPSLVEAVPDADSVLVVRLDGPVPDSLAGVLDTLGTPPDTLSAPPDTAGAGGAR